MSDLIAAFAIVSALAGLVGWGAYAIGTRVSRTAATLAMGMAAGSVLLFLLFLRDSHLVLRLLPVSGVPIYGDPLPILAAAIAGLAGARIEGPRWRRAVLLTPIVLLSMLGPARLLLNEPPPTGNRWDASGVCRQTTPVTCVPAAAATLLMHHGITDASETEMARLCLTTERGTHLFGLYRGLTLKVRNAGLDVVVDHATLGELDRLALPAILCMKLTEEIDRRDPRYRRRWGWQLGVMHTVVLYELTDDGRAVVGDPGAGRERWSMQSLHDLWTGEIVSLQPRGSRDPERAAASVSNDGA